MQTERKQFLATRFAVTLIQDDVAGFVVDRVKAELGVDPQARAVATFKRDGSMIVDVETSEPIADVLTVGHAEI